MYLWIKALHIIALVAWFAGLFYLPRLFVYHSRHPEGVLHEQFCIMERRLHRFIMWPAMVITLICGATMASMNWAWLVDAGWFHAKMAVVLGLIVFHLHCGRMTTGFARGAPPHSERFFRIYNELPTLGLILAVVLVVVRPF
ncbi:MAG: protoporphyrinogen oxidase HemJ [Zetaproteobacteria bacterium]|nr:MAG: protoporphyrinogen oxidase HemJ [Zetaproteobacteria bacterium]